MLYLKTQFGESPENITIEPSNRIILRRNMAQEETEEGTVYTADEVVFKLSYPMTKAEIEADFNSWWAFGVENDSDTEEPTAEERLSAVEEMLAALIGGGDEE